MSREYDAIVIGSGLGGLTAGALYARAGHRVLLLERNHSFGGAASVYQHGHLTIEASLHETTDPHNPHDPKYQIFQALDILDDIEFVPIDNFFEVRGAALGKPFVLPHGIEQIQAALLERFPHQVDGIRKFFHKLKSVSQAMSMLNEKHSGLWWFLHAPSLPLSLWPLLKDMKKNLSEVFQDLFGDDETIKLALAANLGYYADDPDKLWWLFYATAQGGFMTGGGYYIRGGSQALSDCLVKVIIEENGCAEAGHQVTRILLDDNGQIRGVEHQDADGQDTQTDYAPVIFGNAAPHLLAQMLPEPQGTDFFKPYEDKPLSLSLFSVSLGVNKHPAEFGVSSYSTILVPEWMTSLQDIKHNANLLSEAPGQRMPSMGMVDYSRINTGLNSKPPYLVSLVGLDQTSNWAHLSKDAYHQKRDQWLDALINTVDKAYPGIAKAIVQKEMATALTMRDYLNTPNGALYGFAPQPPTSWNMAHFRSPKTPIDNLWLASSFAGAGGFTGAMMGGATAARMALHALRSE